MELAKAMGGVAWVIGIVAVVLEPIVGIIILVIALMLTLWVRSKDREQKHAQLVQAAQEPAQPAAQPASVSDRLAELDRLKAAGALTDEEYETKRQDIIGSL